MSTTTRTDMVDSNFMIATPSRRLTQQLYYFLKWSDLDIVLDFGKNESAYGGYINFLVDKICIE